MNSGIVWQSMREAYRNKSVKSRRLSPPGSGFDADLSLVGFKPTLEVYVDGTSRTLCLRRMHSGGVQIAYVAQRRSDGTDIGSSRAALGRAWGGYSEHDEGSTVYYIS